MVKGTQRKIVPFFNRENQDYIDYKKGDLRFFSKIKSEYFFDKYEGFYFDIETYLDILIAPFYAINKKNDPKYLYSEALAEQFFLLFPSVKEYEKSLNSEHPNVMRYFTSLLDQSEQKDTLLELISSEINRINGHIKILSSFQKENKYYEYILASEVTAKEIKKQLNDLSEKIFLSPPQIVLHKYYLSKPSIAWHEHPLAFFINILYANGLDIIIETWKNDSGRYGDVDSKEKYIDSALRREYAISFRIIENKIRLKHIKEKKQDYITELCLHLEILFRKSLTHPVSEMYPDHLRPYMSLVRNLKNKFKKFTFKVGFNFDSEKDELYIEGSEFLDKLFSATIKDVGWNERKFLKNPVSKTYFRSFLVGDLDSISEIHFNWPPETVYYLLIKLLEHNASFSTPDLEKKGKVFLNNGVKFIDGNYRKFKTLFIQGRKQNVRGSDIIDGLFTR